MIYFNMLVGSDVQRNMPDCETADMSLNHRFNIKVLWPVTLFEVPTKLKDFSSLQ